MIRRQLNDCWKVNDSGDEITHLDDPDNLYGMDDKRRVTMMKMMIMTGIMKMK